MIDLNQDPQSADKNLMANRLISLLFLALIGFGVLGCGSSKSSTSTSSDPIAIIAGPPEAAYCSTTTSYSSPITISGQATYQARQHTGSGLGGAGSAQPIRYAEIIVKDSAGNIAQCAETDASGNYSFQLPNNSQSYTIYVNSRAYNSNLKASVLDSPDSKLYYSISQSFTADGSKTLSTINASVTGEILGGAFNILDQLAEANVYLKAQVNNCSGTYTGCVNVSVAPKVEAYWKKGINPGIYLNSSSVVSYYLPGYSRLFILGGVNGDTDNTDTDHFDNSVIIHEYGHFIEDNLFASNSPGGSHNGNKVIDPRLAWSEGFANFFQAAVLNNPAYQDTYGNSDGTTGFYFKVNLENVTTDIPTAAGEGHFREFSITRLLWDAIDNTPTELVNSALDNVSSSFVDIWAALTKSDAGLNKTSLAFRNAGHFHLYQDALSGTDFSNLRTMEYHAANTSYYAQYVTTGSTCSYSITPTSVTGDNGSFSTSDLLRNNDFYHLKITSSQSVTLQLVYQDADASGNEADLDLYLYNSTARYGVSDDMVGKSENDPDGSTGSSEYESISTTLGAGDYLINVKVYTGGTLGTAANYTLKLNGSQLCQSSLP